jgi:hypothetical protein
MMSPERRWRKGLRVTVRATGTGALLAWSATEFGLGEGQNVAQRDSPRHIYRAVFAGQLLHRQSHSARVAQRARGGCDHYGLGAGRRAGLCRGTVTAAAAENQYRSENGGEG